MKKLFFLFLLSLTPFVRSHAQAVDINDTTRATFYCEAEGIRICLDMGERKPDRARYVFPRTSTCLHERKIYGVWMLTKRERKGGTAILRFTNDIGSDSQPLN